MYLTQKQIHDRFSPYSCQPVPSAHTFIDLDDHPVRRICVHAVYMPSPLEIGEKQ